MKFLVILIVAAFAGSYVRAQTETALPVEKPAGYRERYEIPMAECQEGLAKGDHATSLKRAREILIWTKAAYPADSHPNGSFALGDSLCNEGMILLVLGRRAEGEVLLEAGWPMLARQPEKTDSIEDLKNLKSVYEYHFGMARLRVVQERLPEAVALLENAREIGVKLMASVGLEGDHRMAIDALTAILKMFAKAGKADEARKVVDRILAIRAKHLDGAGFRLAKIALAEAVAEAGAPALGVEIIDPVVAETRASTENPLDSQSALLKALRGKASIEGMAGNPAASRRILQECLAIHERIYPRSLVPNSDLDRTEIIDLIAASHLDQDRLDLAALELRKSLDVCRRSYPRDRYPSGHADLALALQRYGGILFASGYLKDSYSLLVESEEMAEAIRAAEGAGESMESAKACRNIAGCLVAMGRKAEAIARVEKSIGMVDRLLPDELYTKGHGAKVDAFVSPICTLLRAGDAAGAMKLSLRRMAWLQPETRSILDLSPGCLAGSFLQHGEVCLELQKWTEARATCREALRIIDSQPPGNGRDDLQLYEFHALNYLSGIAMKEGDRRETEEMHSRASALFPKLMAGREPTLPWQISLQQMAKFWWERGQKPTAAVFVRAALQVTVKLCERYPSPENLAAAKAYRDEQLDLLKKAGLQDEARQIAAEAVALSR